MARVEKNIKYTLGNGTATLSLYEKDGTGEKWTFNVHGTTTGLNLVSIMEEAAQIIKANS